MTVDRAAGMQAVQSLVTTPAFAENTIHPLVITDAPNGARNLIGRRLTEAGVINIEGTYECQFATHGFSGAEVSIKPNNITGGIAPTFVRLRHNRVAVRETATGSVNMIDATLLTMEFATLRGTQWCAVRFDVGAGEDMEFTPGTDLAAPAAIAEYQGL